MDTRERLLEAARYLFWERGYAASSLNDILHRAKARSAGFYHFFRGKEDLLHAVSGHLAGPLQQGHHRSLRFEQVLTA